MAHRQPKQPRTILRRTLGVLIALGIVVGGLAWAGASIWGMYGDAIRDRLGLVEKDYPGPGEGEVIVTIYAGDIGSDIAASLAEADVVMTEDAFTELLLANPDVTFLPGSYLLKYHMSAQGALDALLDPSNRVERSAAIREGLTVERTLEILAAGTDISLEELEAAAADVAAYDLPEGTTSLEGWLFPANYEFEPEDDAYDIINRLVTEQKQRLDARGVPPEDQLRILTIASIIEKEAGTHADFGKVSRVIYNRLAIDMKLEMDSTAQYGIGDHEDGNVWSSDEALTSENPWNTYVHTGLPIGPIANPGEAALDAALNPEPGDWLFFVVAPGGTGESTFTTTIDEHEAATQRYREWCETTPNSDC